MRAKTKLILSTAIMAASFLFLPLDAFAKLEDCLGTNSDNGVPGRAICVDNILVPASPSLTAADVDGEMWRYGIGDFRPPSLMAITMWCLVLGGSADCLDVPPLFDPAIIPAGKEFTEWANGACTTELKSDTSWINPVFDKNNIKIRESRSLVYGGTKGAECQNEWKETIEANRVRGSACPPGTNARGRPDGSRECWYLPANNCETVGQNGGNTSWGGGASAATGMGMQGKAGLAQSSCNLVGNPINTALVNKVQREEDLPILPGGLQFVRHFNSSPLLPFSSEFSKGTWDYWRHTYMRRIVELDNTTNILGVVWRENGQMDYYGLDGKAVANLNGGTSTLQRTGSGWTLTQSNGDKEYYDDDGRLLSLVTLSGAMQTLTYSDQSTPTNIAPEPGLLITVTDWLGNQLHFGYDDARLIWMVDPAGNVFEYLYNDKDEDDRAGPLAQVVYPDQTTRSYLYDDTRWKYALTGVADSEGNRLTTYTYDSNGNAVSTEQVGGMERYSITSFINNYTLSRSTTATNALGGRVVKEYSPKGGVYKPSSILYYPCSGSGCFPTAEYFTYDTSGNLSEHRTAINTYSQYTYDLPRNLETKRVEGLNQYKQSTPATRTTSTAWHPTLRLPVQIAEPQRITTITYDAAGRVLTRTVQETTDANGSQGFAAISTGAARVWTNTYNVSGQLIHAQLPDGTATAYTYYPVNAACAGNHFGCRGQLQSFSDSQGLTTTFDSYDALGRLLQSTDPYGVVTTQTYNWRGQPLTRTVHAEGLPPLQGCTDSTHR
ncbi:MAG: hypothetical protein LBE75_08645 [Burkholderiales bacterium]|jgi:YD repeat-containing protein|nr:hypothetical protein [Burkholderiales bacterium]